LQVNESEPPPLLLPELLPELPPLLLPELPPLLLPELLPELPPLLLPELPPPLLPELLPLLLPELPPLLLPVPASVGVVGVTVLVQATPTMATAEARNTKRCMVGILSGSVSRGRPARRIGALIP
jgi:hypothetical protein